MQCQHAIRTEKVKKSLEDIYFSPKVEFSFQT